MAASDGQKHSGLVPIAPAPTPTEPNLLKDGSSSQSAMLYACQTCSKRKVKCDKSAPVCSRCRKGRLECVYQAPQPRSRKRKQSSDILERLTRYERILRKNGLLDIDASTSIEEMPQRGSVSTRSTVPGTSGTGKLLTAQGKSRYIDSHIWYNLPDDEIQHMFEDEEEEEIAPDDTSVPRGFTSDPLTGAMMDLQQNLLKYHPSHANAMMLWKIHVENVEPICKVLHIPSTTKKVESVSRHPETASKPDECLLFAIYHVAVFSMTDEECTSRLAEARSSLMQRYHFAARQALVNASFLKTTEMTVLQALYLFLLSSRYSYDPHTYCILTGVAARIALRMGLHLDGEKLGLSPFDVEMRRRLFYQVFPLDGRASQFAGMDMLNLPDSWNTQLPLNINDDQIWPGMTEKPDEQKGATDMLFCLSRACLGKKLARSGKPINGAAPWNFSDHHEAEKVINAAESEVEEKYIRYCDIVNPLHFLTIGLARSGITALRLKIRLPKIKDQTATDEERKELFRLAQKTLDADAAVFAHVGISKYQWHVRPFFLWGTRDSFIFILTTLLKRRDLLSAAEVETAWKSVAQLYQNHDELFEGKQALHVALRRLALKAWDLYQPSSVAVEPGFIRTLRSLRDRREKRLKESDKIQDTTLSADPSPGSDANALLGSVSDGVSFDLALNFDFDVDDWVFWDQLMQDHQT